jgi:hypothetical protein
MTFILLGLLAAAIAIVAVQWKVVPQVKPREVRLAVRSRSLDSDSRRRGLGARVPPRFRARGRQP